MIKPYQIGSWEKSFPDELPLSDKIKASKAVGYDFMEISIDRTDRRINRLYDTSFRKELEKITAREGLYIGSVCLSALGTYTLGSPDTAVREKAMDIFRRALLLSGEFGIKTIQIPAYDVPKSAVGTSETDRLFKENLRKCIDLASVYGITVGLENMENSYMESVTKCMALINEINSPYFQLYPDSGNITSAAIINGYDAETDMNEGRGHYSAFHLKETRPGKYGGLFYGEGHVDFTRQVLAAWRLGARRFVMEYWHIDGRDWYEDLSAAYAFFVDRMKKVV